MADPRALTPVRHGPEPHDDGTVTFRVWAPHTREVTLWLAEPPAATPTAAAPPAAPPAMAPEAAEHLMPPAPSTGPGDDGWFALRVTAGPGWRYGFRLDGGPVRPDPASRRQPDGVHEPSAVVDLAALPFTLDHWRVAPWRSAAVLYELHVGAFTADGTFDAAIPRLDPLVDLGVTHVEVMPVNGFNGTWNWGYDGVAWYAVHEPYGGPEGLARFIDACHARGLGVILDVVYNHLGPSGNYLPEFGPYLTEAGRGTWGALVNLDGPDSDPVRAFIVDNASMWLRDYRLDGLRLDAVHALVDTSARHLLAELADEVAALQHQLGRPLTLIAESDRNDPLTVTHRSRNGMGMTAQWADDLHHGIHTALTGEADGYYVDFAGLPDVATAYQRGFVYDGRYSAYRRRTVGAPLPETSDGRCLVGCLQNHDQVGNRATGDRLTTLVPPALVRLGIVLLCAAPHTPMLWMGEEYGETNPFLFFTSHPEPDLGRTVSEGRRKEFADFASWSAAEVPDPQNPETFQRSTLDWSRAETPAGRARQALWRELLRLRREHAALGRGRRDLVTVHLADASRLLVERRGDDGGTVLVAAYLGVPRRVAAHADSVPTKDAARARGVARLDVAPAELALPPYRSWRVLLDSEDPAYTGDGGGRNARVEDSMLTITAGGAVLLVA